MKISEILLSIPISLLYNAFFHKFAIVIFNDLPFNQRYNNIITTLLLAGIIVVVLNRLCIPKNKIVRDGLGIGGILLIISAIINNWKYMEDIAKLVLTAVLLILVISHSYKR